MILTLWGGYVLWWPTVWLEKYIHRRYLAALIVLIVTGVLLAAALVSVTVIVALQLAQLAASASASSASLNTGLIGTFNLIPGLAKAGPIAALISALATSGGDITSTFLGTARDAVRQVLVSIPVILLQLIVVFFLLLGILGRGDIIVNEFKGAVPLKYRSITNRFLDDLNPIYYSFFVIYFAVAIICGILAAVIYGSLGVPFRHIRSIHRVCGAHSFHRTCPHYVPLALWLIIQGDGSTGLIVLIVSIVLFEGILR